MIEIFVASKLQPRTSSALHDIQIVVPRSIFIKNGRGKNYRRLEPRSIFIKNSKISPPLLFLSLLLNPCVPLELSDAMFVDGPILFNPLCYIDLTFRISFCSLAARSIRIMKGPLFLSLSFTCVLPAPRKTSTRNYIDSLSPTN